MATGDESCQEVGEGFGAQASQNGERITLGAGQRPKTNGPAPKCWQSDTYSSDEPQHGNP